jgi:hypothetical protein
LFATSQYGFDQIIEANQTSQNGNGHQKEKSYRKIVALRGNQKFFDCNRNQKAARAQQDDFETAPGRRPVEQVLPAGCFGCGKDGFQVLVSGVRHKKDDAQKKQAQQQQARRDVQGSFQIKIIFVVFVHGINLDYDNYCFIFKLVKIFCLIVFLADMDGFKVSRMDFVFLRKIP